jgi:hypothetical protein
MLYGAAQGTKIWGCDPEVRAAAVRRVLLSSSAIWNLSSLTRKELAAGYVLEALQYYMLRVVQRIEPSAQWGVLEEQVRGAVTVGFHSTGIVLDSGAFIDIVFSLGTFSHRAKTGTERVGDDALRLAMSIILGFGADFVQDEGESILAPLAALPVPAWAAAAAEVPRFGPRTAGAPTSEVPGDQRVRGDWTLSIGSPTADVDLLSLPPLPPRAYRTRLEPGGIQERTEEDQQG